MKRRREILIISIVIAISGILLYYFLIYNKDEEKESIPEKYISFRQDPAGIKFIGVDEEMKKRLLEIFGNEKIINIHNVEGNPDLYIVTPEQTLTEHKYEVLGLSRYSFNVSDRSIKGLPRY